MGIDGDLYVWGAEVPEEKLALINEGFKEVLGEKDLGRSGPIVEKEDWFSAVPGTVLYTVDLNGARWFHHESRPPRTGWPETRRRIELCQIHFPDHFIIYTHDLAYPDEDDMTGSIVTEELIRLNDAASAKFEEEFRRATKAD